MKPQMTRFGRAAVFSATVGIVASGCASRQADGGGTADDRRSRYDTSGVQDTSGTGFGGGGTMGGSDTASMGDTTWNTRDTSMQYPPGGYPGGSGTGGSGNDTLSVPGTDTSGVDGPVLNPYPGSSYPGTGTPGGSGTGGSGSMDDPGVLGSDDTLGTGPGSGTGTGGAGGIPEVDSLDPDTLPREDSLDVPDWNSGGGY